MHRSKAIVLSIPFLFLMFGVIPRIGAQGLGATDASGSQDGQVVVRERGFGVSRIDYTRCVEFCVQTLPESSPERRTCIAGCSNIDSSFEVDGGLLGGDSER